MKDDLISRRKAFEYFVTLWECIGTIMDRDEWEDVCMTTANEIPSAQPERKKGKWIEFDSSEDKYDVIKCSCCKHTFTVDSYHWTDIGFIKDDFNFCPNCGTDMRGKE